MSASKADSGKIVGRLAGATLAAVLAFAPGAATLYAQEPLTIEPEIIDQGKSETMPAESVSEPMMLDAPQSLEPPEPLPEPAPGEGTPAAGNYGGDGSGQSIQVDILEALNVDSVGTMGLLDGGFGPTLWQGATMGDVLGLLDELPETTQSPALRAVQRRLLLSTAPPPEGAATPGDFVAARLDRLLAMGDYDGVARLLAVTPGRDRDIRFVRIEAGVDLLKGNYAQACGKANTGTRESADPFWQRLLVLCQALSGATAEAEFGLALMNETGSGDPVYERLLTGLLHEEPPVLEIAPASSPMHIAMLRLSKATLADDVITRTSPAALIEVAMSKHVERDRRFALARSLAENNALPPDTLRRLFESAAFDDAMLANPISAVENVGGFEGLALLYQASRAQQVDSARAEAIALAFERAREDGLFPVAAGAFLPVIRSIPARTDLAWFAEDAAKTLIMAGETAVATGWVSILRSAAVLDTEMAAALTRLTPLIHLSDLGQEALREREFAAWWSGIEAEPAGRRNAALVLSLMEGLQPGTTATLWPILGNRAGVRGGVGIDLALWHRLETSAGLGAPGLPVLLATILLGGDGFADADPLAFGHVLRQFTRLGLTDEARAIALEAAVAAGL